MKVTISHNRVAELSASQLYEILGRLFGGDVHSVIVGGTQLRAESIEVRWSEPSEEREI